MTQRSLMAVSWRWAALYFVAVFIVAAGTAFGADDSNQPVPAAGQVIAEIATAGSRSVKASQVLAKVRSRVGERFDADKAAEDARRISEIEGVEYSYYNTGQVEGGIRLTFVVVEKEIVRAIDFRGNKNYKDTTLAKKLDFKVGDYIEPVQAQTDAATISEFYRKKGYAFSEVSLNQAELAAGRAVYDVNEGPRVKIVSVRYSGNDSIKTDELKKAVKSKTKVFIFFQKYYDIEILRADADKLLTAYYDRGYLDAKIETRTEFNSDRSKVRITFDIKEGPVYTVARLTLAGNQYFDEQLLRSHLRLGEGSVFSEKRLEADIKKILALYKETGFINAVVEQKREFVSGDKVAVTIEITEGERFRIGKIEITGNEDSHDKVVRRVLDEYDFKPGQWYNADIARGDGTGYIEKLIRQSVLMEDVRITPTGQTPGQKDAQVNVTEGQTGSIMLGAGVASDSGVIGQIIFEQRNFDIHDTPESFEEFITGKAFKGAGQIFRIALQPGTEVSEYSVSFTEPYLYNKPISMDVIGSSYERWRESYDEERLRGYLGFEKRYKDKWRRSIAFRLENVDITSLDEDAPQEIIDVKGGNLLAGVKLGIGRDMTDDRFNPSTGYTFNTSYEQVGGDHTFGILTGIYRNYNTLYEDLAERKTILSSKLQASTVVGDAPPFEKFYAGGQGSMRGFDYRGVSTRGLQTNVPNPERKDPIGSDWLFLAGTEVTVPMVGETLSWLFFVDSGMIDTGGYRAAVGTGVQIMIPQWFGPVPMRFELGVPVMKDEDDDTQVFSFSVGRLF